MTKKKNKILVHDRIYDSIYGAVVECPNCTNKNRITKNFTGDVTCACGAIFAVYKGARVRGYSRFLETRKTILDFARKILEVVNKEQELPINECNVSHIEEEITTNS